MKKPVRFRISHYPHNLYRYKCEHCKVMVKDKPVYNVCAIDKHSYDYYNHSLCSDLCVELFILKY